MLARQAEVNDLGVPLVANQQVAGFEISMDEKVLVKVCDAFDDSGNQDTNHIFPEAVNTPFFLLHMRLHIADRACHAKRRQQKETVLGLKEVVS